jgi:hypothetical protein
MLTRQMREYPWKTTGKPPANCFPMVTSSYRFSNLLPLYSLQQESGIFQAPMHMSRASSFFFLCREGVEWESRLEGLEWLSTLFRPSELGARQNKGGCC